MSIDMPPELAWVARLAVGQSWPKGDEDKLRALGAAWYDTAQQLDSITKEIGPATLGVRNSISGPVAEQFNAFTQQLQTNLPQMAEAANQIGDLGDNTGVQVEYAKLMVLAQLIWLAYELSTLSFAAPEAIPAAITSARLIVQMILRRLLVSVVSGVGFMVGMDALIQGIQILLLHDRTKWDTDSTIQAVEGGAIGGAIGGVLGGGLGAFAPKFAGSLIGKLAVGGATGVITTATMTAAFGGDADFTSALTSGLVGALGGGKHGRGGEEGKTKVDPVHLKDITAPDLHLPDIHPADVHAPDVHAPDAHTPDVHTPDARTADVHSPAVRPTDTAPAPVRTGSGDDTAGVKEATASDTRPVTVSGDTGTHSIDTPDVRTTSTPSVSESHASSDVTHGQTDTSVGTQERTSPRTTDTTVESPARTTASRGETGTTAGSGLHSSETTSSTPSTATTRQELGLPGFETRPTDTTAGNTRPAETPATTGVTGPAVADRPTVTDTARATNSPATSGDSNTATATQTRPTQGQAPAQAPAQAPRVTTETGSSSTSTDGRTGAPVRTTSEPAAHSAPPVAQTESHPTAHAPADQPTAVHTPVEHTPVEHVGTGPAEVHHPGTEHTPTPTAPDAQPPLPPHTSPPEPPLPAAPHEPVRVELGPIGFDGGSADLTAPRQQALNTTARQVADLGVRNARDGGGPPVVTVEGRANVLDQGLPHFGKSLKLGQERAEAVATALRSELKDRLERLQSDGPTVLRGEDVTVVPRSRGNQDFEPGSPEHTGDHVAVHVELPPPPRLESDPGTPHETHEQPASVVVPQVHVPEPTPEPVARPVRQPASPDWRSRLDGAPTARVHTERFDPARDPLKGNAPHSLAGSQTLVRSVVRRVQAENGTWVRHHTVELPVNLGHSGMSAGELNGVHERIQRAIDRHLNGGLELPRSGDQFHLDLRLVAGDDHPEAITIGRNDHQVPLDQRSWNVPVDPAHDDTHLPRVVHEVLHYLGLKDEYQDDTSLFRRSDDSPAVHRDGLMGHDVSGSSEVPRRYLETIEDTVDHTAVVKDHPHGAPDAPETATRTDLPHLGADDLARWDAPHVLTVEGTVAGDAEHSFHSIGAGLEGHPDLHRRWYDPAQRPSIVKVLKEWAEAPAPPSMPTADGSHRLPGSPDALSRVYRTKDQAASAVLDRVKSLPMAEIERDLALSISQDTEVHASNAKFVTDKLVPWLRQETSHNAKFTGQLGSSSSDLAALKRLYLPFVEHGPKTIEQVLGDPRPQSFSTLISAIHDVAELMYMHPDDLAKHVTVKEIKPPTEAEARAAQGDADIEFRGYVLGDIPDPAAERTYPNWTSPTADRSPNPPLGRTPVERSFRGTAATPNQLDPHVATAGRLGYPVSLGPSRTTGKLIRLAHEAGASEQEKKALAFSLLSLWYTDYRRDLTDIHRYHFVMDMAANFGVDYDPFSRPVHPVHGRDVYGDLINDALARHRATTDELQRTYVPTDPPPVVTESAPAEASSSAAAPAQEHAQAQPALEVPQFQQFQGEPDAMDVLNQLVTAKASKFGIPLPQAPDTYPPDSVVGRLWTRLVTEAPSKAAALLGKELRPNPDGTRTWHLVIPSKMLKKLGLK